MQQQLLYQVDNTVDTSRQISNFQCLQIMAGLPGIYIKQQWSAVESLTGCQTPNHFFIYQGDFEGKQVNKDALLIAKEKSECCQRILCPADCRAFELNVRTHVKGRQEEIVMRFERHFACTFLCCNRPSMEVEMIQGDYKESIGKILCPFYCCDKGLHIIDKNGVLKYKVVANCCQMGLLCPMPCAPCQKVDFQIYNASGEKVGDLFKVTAGFCKALCCPDDTDCFRIPFPSVSSPEDKILFLAATLFIDYRFFEVNRDEQKAQKGLEGAAIKTAV